MFRSGTLSSLISGSLFLSSPLFSLKRVENNQINVIRLKTLPRFSENLYYNLEAYVVKNGSRGHSCSFYAFIIIIFQNSLLRASFFGNEDFVDIFFGASQNWAIFTCRGNFYAF